MIKSKLLQWEKQNYELQREVLVNRNRTRSKTNNRSDSNIAPHKDKSFHHMTATDEIILQPESVIKKPVVENNTRWRKKTT